MYENFSNIDIAAELRLYETICRHTEQEAAADLAKRASEIIDELMKERDDLNTQYTKAIYEVMPKWIPVTERLPYAYKKVLTYERMRGVQVNFCDDDGDWWVGSKITHWMSLPELPEED